MEGKRLVKQRSLRRVGEPHRVEEELWVAAYERICPLVRRRTKQRKSAPENEPLEGLAAGVHIARRA